MSSFVDTHCHIQSRDFNSDRADVIARARDAGVGQLVVIGEDERSSRAALTLAESNHDLFATAGLHPHDARDADERLESWLTELAAHPACVAIGEIGLDYHYDRSPRSVQRAVFERQLAVAATAGKPVSIHSREAEADTLALLESWVAGRPERGMPRPFGVMHCFGYGPDTAERCVALGFAISIPGVVTFQRADLVQSVAMSVPLSALVLETDAPVLAPHPHRGRRNEPSYLIHTARQVAELRGVSLDELATATSATARELFRIPAPRSAAAPLESLRA